MFSFARSKGFFLGLATFWCHWAERFELDQMVKDADRVLAEGEQILRASPEELQKLEKWRTTFDVRIASGVSIQVAKFCTWLITKSRLLLNRRHDLELNVEG